jgi:hypothetical protein
LGKIWFVSKVCGTSIFCTFAVQQHRRARARGATYRRVRLAPEGDFQRIVFITKNHGVCEGSDHHASQSKMSGHIVGMKKLLRNGTQNAFGQRAP